LNWQWPKLSGGRQNNRQGGQYEHRAQNVARYNMAGAFFLRSENYLALDYRQTGGVVNELRIRLCRNRNMGRAEPIERMREAVALRAASPRPGPESEGNVVKFRMRRVLLSDA
jgi:hypothetical protein